MVSVTGHRIPKDLVTATFILHKTPPLLWGLMAKQIALTLRVFEQRRSIQSSSHFLNVPDYA